MTSLTLLSRQPKTYILEPAGNRPIKESNRNPSIDQLDNRKEKFIRTFSNNPSWLGVVFTSDKFSIEDIQIE